MLCTRYNHHLPDLPGKANAPGQKQKNAPKQKFSQTVLVSQHADKNGQCTDVAFLKEMFLFCDFIESNKKNTVLYFLVLIAYLNNKQKAW
jgi:hypothetical protein